MTTAIAATIAVTATAKASAVGTAIVGHATAEGATATE